MVCQLVSAWVWLHHGLIPAAVSQVSIVLKAWLAKRWAGGCSLNTGGIKVVICPGALVCATVGVVSKV